MPPDPPRFGMLHMPACVLYTKWSPSTFENVPTPLNSIHSGTFYLQGKERGGRTQWKEALCFQRHTMEEASSLLAKRSFIF